MSRIKKGRFSRLTGLGKIGARAATTAVLGRGAHQKLAQAMVRELGAMKGLPMKVGQLFSYMDGLVPEAHRDVYLEALAALRAHAPAVDNEGVLALLEEELGGSRHELFERFDDVPISSASIGQVYAARFEGEEVCVKVQYPDIKDATVDDLANVDAIKGLAKLFARGIDVDSIIDNFKARLFEEFDYEREADMQRHFATIYADDPDILVPAVIDPRTTPRVLTTARLSGTMLEAYLPTASSRDRDRFGLALFRFAFGSLIQHRLFHADPHPGNLMFGAGDNQLGILDYGCVQPFTDEEADGIAQILFAAAEGRSLKDPLIDGLGIEADDATLDELATVTALTLRPVSEAQPYTFTPQFSSEIAARVTEAKLRLSARILTRRSYFGLDADGFTFIVRNLFGLAHIWGQLGSTADFRDALLRMRDAPGADDAPSPPPPRPGG